MYVHFIFDNCTNGYITTNNKRLFDMIFYRELTQISENGFYVSGYKELNKTYKNCQSELSAFAQQWQYDANKFHYSYDDLIEWGNFFAELGGKYGLLTEFRENGIL